MLENEYSLPNGMQVIPAPRVDPGHCIASLVSEDPEGFIDTGLNPNVHRPHIIVSVGWIKEQARLLGLTDTDQKTGPLHELERREYVQKIAELEKELAAVKRTIQIVTPPRGRPPKVTA